MHLNLDANNTYLRVDAEFPPSFVSNLKDTHSGPISILRPQSHLSAREIGLVVWRIQLLPYFPPLALLLKASLDPRSILINIRHGVVRVKLRENWENFEAPSKHITWVMPAKKLCATNEADSLSNQPQGAQT